MLLHKIVMYAARQYFFDFLKILLALCCIKFTHYFAPIPFYRIISKTGKSSSPQFRRA